MVDAVVCRILGPVGIEVGGKPVKLSRRRERHLLALLLLHVGRPVSTQRLLDLLWPDDKPADARLGLQTSVSRLRATLTAVDGVDLVRRGDGYAIATDPENVDACRFRRLVERAERATDASERAELARRALSLWRGPALADVGTESDRLAMSAGLDALRRQALHIRIGADLERGRQETLVAELAEIVAADPLDELFVGHLVVALYRSGRRHEALETCRRVRSQIAAQLGAHPSAELRRLELAVLRSDLDPPAGKTAGPNASSTVPVQLPMDLPGFVGRTRELAQLDAAVHSVGERPTAVVVSAVSGTAGVGKTALAVHWAHRVADRFPDGQLYVNLRGHDQAATAMTTAEAVRVFLDALHVAPEAIPVTLDGQIGLYRSVLAGRRALVVLDNARDADQVRPLLPGSPGCLVVVTSRDQLSGLVAVEGAHPIVLDLLSAAESRQLLAHRIGRQRVDTELAATDDIVGACARLPLALTIAAARAAANPTFPLAALVKEFAAANDALSAFDLGDSAADVRGVFLASYRTLTAPAARLFRLLGLHPGPDISAPAAASLAGLPPHEVRPLLRELTRSHLLMEHAYGRYAFHDLLRAYARELAHARHSDAGRRAAVLRACDHYLRTAHAAAAVLVLHRTPIVLADPVPGVEPEPMGGITEALAWLTAEYRVLLAIQAQAMDAALDRHVWQLAWAMEHFLMRRGLRQQWFTVHNRALTAARRAEDPVGQAHAHRGLAGACMVNGSLDDAAAHLQRSLHLFRELGDASERANALLNLAMVRSYQERWDEAIECARQALEQYRAAGDQRGQAQALNHIGWYHAKIGSYQEALTHCQAALDLSARLADPLAPDQLAVIWDSVGYACHHLGVPERALACYQRAIALHREAGYRRGEASALAHLADTYDALGDVPAARRAQRDALAILDELSQPNVGNPRAALS
jgi:DNA-binding SARP family transcriptional activator